MKFRNFLASALPILFFSGQAFATSAGVSIPAAGGGSGDGIIRSAAVCTAETGGVLDEVCIVSGGGAGSGLWRCTAANCEGLNWERVDDTAGFGGGITAALLGDDNANPTDGATVSIDGDATNGLDGIDTDSTGAGNIVTLSFDATEIDTETWGAAAQLVWTFDAGATDPTLTIDSDQVAWTNAATFTVDGQQVLTAASTVSALTTLGAAVNIGSTTADGTIIIHDDGTVDSTVTIQKDENGGTSYTLTLPVDDGTTSQVLTTDGSGVLSWGLGGQWTDAGTAIVPPDLHDVIVGGNEDQTCDAGEICFDEGLGRAFANDFRAKGTAPAYVMEDTTSGTGADLQWGAADVDATHALFTMSVRGGGSLRNWFDGNASTGAFIIGDIIDVDAITLDTSTTGTASIKMPAGAVDSTEILDDQLVNADINSAAAIAISKTALVADGTAGITLTTNTLSADDDWVKNSDNDVMAGTLTADGLTMDNTELITIGVGQTLTHDGTDFVFNDTLSATGFVASPSATPNIAFKDSDMGGTPDINGQVLVNCPGTGTTATNDEDCDMDFKTQAAGTLTTAFRIDTDTNGLQTVPFAVATTLQALDIEAGEYAADSIDHDDLNDTLTFEDGTLLDFGLFLNSSTEGILLPRNTSCASATGEGQICWDSNDQSSSALWIGDGGTARNITGGAEVNAITTTAPTAIIDNQLFIGTGSGTATYDTLIDCDGAGKALNYDATTHNFDCITGLSSGGTVSSIQGDLDTATNGAILSIDGTTAGIDTAVASDTLTVSLDLTELATATLGVDTSAPFTVLTIDSTGANDPTFTFLDDSIKITNAATFWVEGSQVQTAATTTSGITSTANVTAAELAQLETIGLTTISANQWVALGGINEALTFTELNLLDDLTTLTGANTGDEVVADLTTSGTIEVATVAETNTGTDATRAVSPAGLEGWTGSAAITTVGTLASPTLTTPVLGVAAATSITVTSQEECVMLEASAINCSTTTGCALVETIDVAAFDYTTADFEGTTDSDEDGTWSFQLPKNLNGTTFVAHPFWSSPTVNDCIDLWSDAGDPQTTGAPDGLCDTGRADKDSSVCWGVSARGVGNGEDWETVAFGTMVYLDDVATSVNDLYETGDITVTHTWSPGERATVKILRDNTAVPTGCSFDDFEADVSLHALEVCYTVGNVFSGQAP